MGPVILWNGTFPVVQMVKNLPEMQEIQVLSLGWEDPLEKGVATHSRILARRILARRIPWTEEPGSLQSTWSQSWTRLKNGWTGALHSLQSFCDPVLLAAQVWADPNQSDHLGMALFEPLRRKTPIPLVKTHCGLVQQWDLCVLLMFKYLKQNNLNYWLMPFRGHVKLHI